MELLTWDGSMSVGIDIIDEEHAKLTQCINELHEAIESRSSRDKIVRIFDDFLEYTLLHFQHEEALFVDTDYPEEEQRAHIVKHNLLRERLYGIQSKLKSGDTMVVSNEFMGILVEWLIHHAQEVDMGYVPYVKKKLEKLESL